MTQKFAVTENVSTTANISLTALNANDATVWLCKHSEHINNAKLLHWKLQNSEVQKSTYINSQIGL